MRQFFMFLLTTQSILNKLWWHFQGMLGWLTVLGMSGCGLGPWSTSSIHIFSNHKSDWCYGLTCGYVNWCKQAYWVNFSIIIKYFTFLIILIKSRKQHWLCCIAWHNPKDRSVQSVTIWAQNVPPGTPNWVSKTLYVGMSFPTCVLLVT